MHPVGCAMNYSLGTNEAILENMGKIDQQQTATNRESYVKKTNHKKIIVISVTFFNAQLL